MKKRELFAIFFMIGLTTIGGGYAMIPQMEHALVAKRKWMSSEEFMNALCVAQSIPGPLAINTAAYLGYHFGGVSIAMITITASVLPSFLIILLIALFATTVENAIWLQGFFYFAAPVVTALITAAAIDMGIKLMQGENKFVALLVFVITFVLLFVFHFNPAIVVIASILLGIFGLRRRKKKNCQAEQIKDEKL
ncbi:MAG: chromate transporter [Clostridia bacterium]